MAKKTNIKNKFYRPTWAEINLANLVFNLRQVKKMIGEKVKVLAAVKANAYGHGLVCVCQALERCGVDYLGVACVDEAKLLRDADIKTPILILGTLLSEEEISLALKLNVTLTIADSRMYNMISRMLKAGPKPAVHIKIDTGMGRIGIWHKQALDFINRLGSENRLFIEGIYTHFASADSDRNFTDQQIDIFKNLLSQLEKRKIDIPLHHAANSIAVCRLKDTYLNMVRPGLMLYGIYPHPNLRKWLSLRPVLSFKTKITYLKEVEAGRSISYGRKYITRRKTKIATIPVGYADGYNRLLSNRAQVLIRGQIVPVVGTVCMDQTMLDVGHIPKVKIGNTVVLIGKQKKNTITAEDLASLCHTIPYEITCGISSRVSRVFKNR